MEERIRQLQKHLNEKNKALMQINQKWRIEKQLLENKLNDKYRQISEFQKSMSWKITSPLRAVHGILTRRKR